MGKSWMIEDLEAAVEVGPHISALDPEAIEQLQSEVAEEEDQGRSVGGNKKRSTKSIENIKNSHAPTQIEKV